MKILTYVLLLTFALIGQSHGTTQTPDNSSQATSGSNSTSSNNSANRSSSRSSIRDTSRQSSTSTVNIEGDHPSVASVFPDFCQTGISASGERFGISMTNNDPLCDYWRGAEQSLAAYEREVAKCSPVTCTVNCSIEFGYVEASLDPCEGSSARAQQFLQDYYDNMDQAQKMLSETSTGAMVDRYTQLWQRFILIVGIIIWL